MIFLVKIMKNHLSSNLDEMPAISQNIVLTYILLAGFSHRKLRRIRRGEERRRKKRRAMRVSATQSLMIFWVNAVVCLSVFDNTVQTS